MRSEDARDTEFVSSWIQATTSRLQASLDALALSAKKHTSLSAEIVIVEWNPPADRDSLAMALRPLDGLPHTRIVTVPASVLDSLSFKHRDSFPQFIAKNIGLRYARGNLRRCSCGEL